MPKGFIYIHQNKLNNKVYVGQTRNYDKRCKDHQYSACYNYNTKFQKAVNKYGWDGFNHLIVFEDECTQLELDLLEKFWISHLKADGRDTGYNLKPGGNTGPLSEETKEKISKAHKGKKLTEEHKRKVSEAGKGKKRSEETKDNISKALIGNKYALGTEWTEERRTKSLAAMRGVSKCTKGKTLSEETLQKRAASRLRNKQAKLESEKVDPSNDISNIYN